MNHGFVRAACATPKLKLADCKYNAEQIISLIEKANEQKVSIIVFPELSITGYTCGNLFFNRTLQEDSNEALKRIAEKTKSYEMLIIIGFMHNVDSKLYNCAAVLCKGKILGIVPKENIPNYSQYSEMRYFAEGEEKGIIKIMDQDVPFGTDLIFKHNNLPELCIGVEICEDLWVSNSPANKLAAGGATIIANLSASDERVGKAEKRRTLINAQSSKLIIAYLYANAGQGESSTDLVYSGHNIISENGEILSESQLFSTGLTIADVDLQIIESERQRLNTFEHKNSGGRTVFFDLNFEHMEIKRKIPQNPFINPSPNTSVDSFCNEVLSLQEEGLISRLRNIGIKKIVLGVSGGLDSTLALIIAADAFDKLEYDRKDIICVSMPGFGTSSRTKNNSKGLIDNLNASYVEIPIEAAIKQHFKDIGQGTDVHDVTYENAQARERTQILMDLANMNEAIVLGTGDLSEIALGFSTYNGDHMSMYNVNAGVPKTLIKEILKYHAKKCNDIELEKIVLDIINTPVSPELLPTSSNNPEQITEDIIGPYELHDFFIYYFLRYGFTTEKILEIASIAFKGKYKKEEIKRYLSIFIKRFFESQFKRSCQPDGPKVLDISLSPRSTFMMPSDIKVPEHFI